MYNVIISHPSTTKSARPLAEELSELTGIEFGVHIHPEKIRRDGKLAIRYGTSIDIPGQDEVNLNSPEHISLAGNKLRLSKFLSSLPEEEYVRNLELTNEMPKKFPVVVRQELNRGGGIGLVFCKTQEEFLKYRGQYWTTFYPFEFELGVHILDGKIMKVFKKVRDEALPKEEFPRRNTNNGYRFVLKARWADVYTGLEKFVTNLYRAVPISFARLDIGYHKLSGGYRLIEINSAPDLSQNADTLNMYANFLATKFRKE